ncbi:MAG: hypothetical protein N2544_10690 [Burkholderiales bacterium]|nr:hypothetical protein [Burkholderiales bacterium]
MKRLPVVLVLCAALAAPAAAQRPPPTRFDGMWEVTVVCADVEDPNTRAVARGYTWRFTGEVKDGRFRGQYGEEGASPSMLLLGRITEEGTAAFRATGKSANPDHAVGRVPAGTPFRYTADGRFDETRGSASRNETRPCDLTFTKRSTGAAR